MILGFALSNLLILVLVLIIMFFRTRTMLRAGEALEI